MKGPGRPVLATTAIALLLTSIAGLIGIGAAAQQPVALVIEGGTLIDGNGGTPLIDSAVVIEGNRITSVSRRGQLTYPANARIIDARGKFVLPGLGIHRCRTAGFLARRC